MTVEVTPVGMACNLACTYCYENSMRDAGNIDNTGYDFEAIKEKVLKYNHSFTLFGGEPLVAPIERVEELLKLSFENYGRASIQSNGVLINDQHIKLFEQYNVHVGISIDGPGEMNDIRWNGTIENTRKATQQTEDNIQKMLQNNIGVSIIVTLHKLNASSKDKLERLKEWCKQLHESGVNAIRLHILEVDNPVIKSKYVLSNDEYLAIYIDMFEYEKNVLKFDLFDKSNDMYNMLVGDDRGATCTWVGCDVYNTKAVQGIGADGTEHNCGRANKEGVDYVKSDDMDNERSIALYHTPQEYNGCQDCRFFLMCQGYCPGTAVDGDWRNKTQFCSIWKGLFSYFELKILSEGKHPFSMSPKREETEKQFIAELYKGNKPKYYNIINNVNTTHNTNHTNTHENNIPGKHEDSHENIPGGHLDTHEDSHKLRKSNG